MTINKGMITVLTREEMFTTNCKIFDLRREYPGYDGEICWAIATSYSNNELRLLFSDFLVPYEPFMLLSVEEGKAFKDYNKNEKKHSWRNTHCVDAFGYVDGEMELFHPELITSNLEDDFIKNIQNELLYELLLKLTEKQRKYIVLHYMDGVSIRQLALNEGVNHKTIYESIASGIKKLRKFLKNTPPK